NYEKDKHKQQDVKDPTTPSLRVENSCTLTTQEKCDLPHFKQLTRIILESFPTPGKRYATIELSDDDLKMLQEFKDNDVEGKKMYDVLELIIDIFERIQEDERLEQTFFTRILAFVEYHKEVFAVIFIISILIFILLIFETRTTLPWYRQCWYLFGLLFIVSIPWEWFRLYRKEYAEKQAELVKKMPSHCASKNMTITERMSLWMTGLLSWSVDDCIKFQEAILVDPVWEVSPSVALSTTVTRLLFKPLEYVAHSCGRSLNAFLEKVPTVWQPIMFVLITIFLLLFILLFTKSRIKFGFFEIGPAPTQVRRLGRDEINALENCIRQEIRNVIRREAPPLRNGNVDELPRIGRAVQEERADDRHIPSDVRETESPEYDIPVTQIPAT
ncbi:Hypothetical predicted protein, partial [Paramuricea clavata]